jgi:hypothetical protein
MFLPLKLLKNIDFKKILIFLIFFIYLEEKLHFFKEILYNLEDF